MSVVDEKALGKHLQLARQKAGLTQQDLCHKSGLSYSTLAKIERGAIKAPSIFTISQIAAVLGVSLDELVGEVTSKMSIVSSLAKKHSKSGVSFVFFDINGCLVRFFHRAFTEIAEASGAKSDIIETLFWHHNDAVCSGQLSIEKFNSIFAKEFGLVDFDWRKFYLEAIDPILDMQRLVSWAAENYHIGLLSNIMPGLIDSLLEEKIIPAVNYDVIVDSSVVKAIKPDPKIYKIAQEKTGVKPSEILLVDDSRANIVAAERAGWHVLWFDDYRPSESAARIRSALEF